MRTDTHKLVRKTRKSIETTRILGLFLDVFLTIVTFMSFPHLEFSNITLLYLTFLQINLQFEIAFAATYIFRHYSYYKIKPFRIIMDVTVQIMQSWKKLPLNNKFVENINVHNRKYYWELIMDIDNNPQIMDEEQYSASNNRFQQCIAHISDTDIKFSENRRQILLVVFAFLLLIYVFVVYIFYLYNYNMVLCLPIVLAILLIRFMLVNLLYYTQQIKSVIKMIKDKDYFDLMFASNTQLLSKSSLLFKDNIINIIQ